ncbi:hypothetical protein J0383_18855 [Flavobacterium endoglycinae]|uniref:Uncharacterized protein n=1 Tax=Flavobacterium endoglycinae TaxID=2816357 RepID=A0ABX7QB95_9FLAO|nr:hypothetical protein [Flavobacterium endoglycinae]QSW88310.1 hypothetical protein J0383_18855 [Flavobacterium endoglycinae]
MMLKFPYYLVFNTINVEMIPYPVIFTASLSEDKASFIIIDNLEEYLKDGKSGLSDKSISVKGLGFVLIDDYNWKSRINGAKFF